MSIPTTLREGDESFDDWVRRVETDLVDAFQDDRYCTFGLLRCPDGTAEFTREPGESDEFFFRRVQAQARDQQATQFVGATLGQFNAGPLGAVTCLLWYAADSAENRAAHGLGQVFGRTVYSHQQVAPGNAPRTMRDVVRVSAP